MSTNRSVGRSASTQEKVRSTATRNTARSAATQEHGRPASKSKKDRSPNLCTFAFADGRQCRTPRCSGHLHFCYFHAQKEAESLAAQQVGQDISRFLPTKLLTACDLGVALSRTFCAVAQGQIKPKVASTLGYLAQTMLQSIPIAQHEYCESLGTNYWRSAIRSSFNVTAPEPKPAPQPQTAPKPPDSASAPPTPVEAGLHPGSSASSPTSPAPQAPVNCHSDVVAQAFRPEESAFSSNSSLATHHSPLLQPPPLPPGFGAPANWDILIPPRPRRRFSRHWHFPE